MTMRRLGLFTALLTLAALGAGFQPPPPSPADPIPAAKPADPAEADRAKADHAEAARFESVDVFIDPAGKPLAAYQIELKAANGDVKAVGIEGGESAAFSQAPYYDPAALHDTQLRERIVLAAFNTGKTLPGARTRVARVHVRIVGAAPEYTVKLMAAGTDDGSRIEAKVEAVPTK